MVLEEVIPTGKVGNRIINTVVFGSLSLPVIRASRGIRLRGSPPGVGYPALCRGIGARYSRRAGRTIDPEPRLHPPDPQPAKR